MSSFLVVPVSRSRDSGPLEESNFVEGLRLLGGESDTVQIPPYSMNRARCPEWVGVSNSPTCAVAPEEHQRPFA